MCKEIDLGKKKGQNKSCVHKPGRNLEKIDFPKPKEPIRPPLKALTAPLRFYEVKIPEDFEEIMIEKIPETEPIYLSDCSFSGSFGKCHSEEYILIAPARLEY